MKKISFIILLILIVNLMGCKKEDSKVEEPMSQKDKLVSALVSNGYQCNDDLCDNKLGSTINMDTLVIEENFKETHSEHDYTIKYRLVYNCINKNISIDYVIVNYTEDNAERILATAKYSDYNFTYDIKSENLTVETKHIDEQYLRSLAESKENEFNSVWELNYLLGIDTLELIDEYYTK